MRWPLFPCHVSGFRSCVPAETVFRKDGGDDLILDTGGAVAKNYIRMDEGIASAHPLVVLHPGLHKPPSGVLFGVDIDALASQLVYSAYPSDRELNIDSPWVSSYLDIICGDLITAPCCRRICKSRNIKGHQTTQHDDKTEKIAFQSYHSS